MSEFQYIRQKNCRTGKNLDNWLNEMGKQKWELCGVIQPRVDGGYTEYIFKRTRQHEW